MKAVLAQGNLACVHVGVCFRPRKGASREGERGLCQLVMCVLVRESESGCGTAWHQRRHVVVVVVFFWGPFV